MLCSQSRSLLRAAASCSRPAKLQALFLWCEKIVVTYAAVLRRSPEMQRCTNAHAAAPTTGKQEACRLNAVADQTVDWLQHARQLLTRSQSVSAPTLDAARQILTRSRACWRACWRQLLLCVAHVHTVRRTTARSSSPTRVLVVRGVACGCCDCGCGCGCCCDDSRRVSRLLAARTWCGYEALLTLSKKEIRFWFCWRLCCCRGCCRCVFLSRLACLQKSTVVDCSSCRKSYSICRMRRMTTCSWRSCSKR